MPSALVGTLACFITVLRANAKAECSLDCKYWITRYRSSTAWQQLWAINTLTQQVAKLTTFFASRAGKVPCLRKLVVVQYCSISIDDSLDSVLRNFL
eukprot:scaffold115_cov304-Prasinococcus_capsulatus_cf.AAC.36